MTRGARLLAGEAVAFDAAGRSIGVQLENGREIEAKAVVLATGYVMPDIVKSSAHNISSSWAIATRPQPHNVWKDGALIWDATRDYLYAHEPRGAIIISGRTAGASSIPRRATA